MNTIENISDSTKLIYSCPIFQHVFKDSKQLNDQLKKMLLTKEQAMPELNTGDINRSNVAGWKSKDDLLKWEEPGIQELTQRVIKAVEAMMNAAPRKKTVNISGMQLYAWANINREGSYNTMHNHPGNHWAAVYYVDIGKPDPKKPKSGIFELQDPRAGAANMQVPGFDFGDKVSFRPQPGMLVLFPAWMNHCVHPFFGDGERISIAFNVKLDTPPIQKPETEPSARPK